MEEYRKQTVIAIQDMIICRHNILKNIVHLALSGELIKFAEAVTPFEDYPFVLNHFRNLEDLNIKTLVQICDKLDSKMVELITANDIDYNELNFEAI